MPDDGGGGGIYLSDDSARKLDGDLFGQTARGLVADAWGQQMTAALPDMLEQAHAAEAQRQAAAAKAQADAEQAQRDQTAEQWHASISAALPDMVRAAGGDPSMFVPPTSSDSLTAPMGPVATGGPSESSQVAPQPTPSPDTAPDSASLPPTPTAPLVAPPSMQQPSAPVAAVQPTPAAPAPAAAAPVTPVAAATQTTAGLSGGGDLSGRVGAAGQAIMSAAADTASWLGDQGQKALQAVLLTEGGLNKARGDAGASAGPLQFFGEEGGRAGQLNAFASQHGLSLAQARSYIEDNPEAAVSWAIGTPDAPGYMGQAILNGLKQGLSGPDLATYAQQHGQVSVSPERAGQNWQSLFGQGGDIISGVAQGATRVLNAAVQSVVDRSPITALDRTSQFGLGLSSADAYAACGPAAALAFAKATGHNPTAQEALDLAKSVGWTQGAGMAGPSSEVSLLSKMGVSAHLEAGADPTKIATDVSNGNPVIISTSGHYFTADSARTNADGAQEFHVGTSGTDLKHGSEWMTLGQMQNVMGAIQGTLYLDRQPGDGPSVAVQQGAADTAQAPASSSDQTAASTSTSWLNPLKGIGDAVGNAVSTAGNAVGAGASAVGGAVQSGLSGLGSLFGGSGDNPAAPATPTNTTPTGGGVLGSLAAPVDVQQQNADNLGKTVSDAAGNAVTAAGSALPPVNLPPPDPASPLGRSLAGQTLSGPEQLQSGLQAYQGYQAARDQATANLNPLRDVPFFGGVINSLTDPLMATSVKGGAELLGRGADALAGHLAAPVESAVADAAGNATAPLSFTPVVTGGAQPAAASLPFATGLGGAAAGGGATYAATDPSDPNRILKIAGGALAGAAAGAGIGLASDSGALDVVGQTANRVLAPLLNTPAGVQSAVRDFVGDVAKARTQGETLSLSGAAGPSSQLFLEGQAKQQLMDRLTTLPSPAGAVPYVPGARLLEGYVPGARVDPQLGGYALPQDVATALSNVLHHDGGSAAAQGVLNALGTAKEVMLSLSPFHLVTELRQAYRANNPQDAVPMIGQALWNTLSPNYDAFRLANADLYDQAAKAGVTMLTQGVSPDLEGRLTGLAGTVVRGGVTGAASGVGGYTETKREGGSDQQALQNGLIAGVAGTALGAVVAKPMADALFSRVVPTLKVLTYGLKAAGGADPQAAATFVNQTFGGENLDMIARGQGTQQFLRLGMLAPDWWSGWARQVGGAFNPGDVGTMSRGYWARTLGEAGFALEGLNYAINGHLSTDNEPGHQLDLETTGLVQAKDPKTGLPLRTYADVLGPIKSIATVALSPTSPTGPADAVGTFVHSKLGLLPSLGLTIASNTSGTGRPIVPKGTPALQAAGLEAENALSRISPIGAAQTMRTNEQLGTVAAAVSDLTGLRLTAGKPAPDPVTTMLNQAGIPTPLPPRTVPISSKYSIDLTPEDQRTVEQLRVQALHDAGSELVNDPDFAAAPIAQRNKILQRLMTQADQAAAKQFAEQIPEGQLEQRILDHQAKRAPQPITTSTGRSSGAPLSLTPATQPTVAPRPSGSAAPPATLSLTPASQPTGNITFPFGQPTKAGTCQMTAGGPDSGCTPGSTLEGVDASTISQPGYAKAARAVPQAQKQAIYDAYGIPGHAAGQYEIDHLVPLALGGSNHSSNLWPQPAVTSDQGFHEKDIVEVHLWQEVKAGRMTLADAQRQVVNNWRDVYANLTPAQRTAITKGLSNMTPEEKAAVTN